MSNDNKPKPEDKQKILDGTRTGDQKGTPANESYDYSRDLIVSNTFKTPTRDPDVPKDKKD